MSSNPNQQDPPSPQKTTTNDDLIKPKPKKGIQAEFENPFYGTRKGQQLYFRKLAGKK